MFLSINTKFKMLVSLLFIGWSIQLQAQSRSFVTTWEVIDNDEITIPTVSILTYNYTVDWGDGVSDTITYTGNATHTYPAAGTYTVAISDDFPAIYFNNLFPVPGHNSLKIKTIKSWGTQRWRTLDAAFRGCQNLTTIEDGPGVPDLTMVTGMLDTFYGATSFNGDLSSWDVSNVTSMRSMFCEASSFNSDLSSWNVSKVTSIYGAFIRATSFNGDLSSWNVSNVADMGLTFLDATSFNGDLSSWDVSNVTYMAGTFLGATSFKGDISSWDVSKVTDMSYALGEATNFTSDLSRWNVSNVIRMWRTFSGATSFSSENYDALLTGWSSLPSLQRGIRFGAPPTTYCAGKAGRDILTGAYNWDIRGDSGEDCSGVSVDEEFLSNTKIYPNPTNDKINIESSFEIDKLELYNVLGAKLFSVSKMNTLELTNLSEGIYILKAFSEDKVVSRKVIKD